MERKSVHVAEGDAYYFEGGIGPNLLFLHGGFATPEAYFPLLSFLTNRYHVVAPIHPGHGLTFPIPKDWKLRDELIYYENFFSEISFVPDILIGHSFGGLLALLLGARNIGSCVVAMDAPMLPFVFSVSSYLKAMIQESSDAVRSKRDPVQISETTRAAATLIETLTRHPEVASQFASAGSKYNATSEIRKIRKPVGLLWGELDQIVPVETGNYLQVLISGSRLTVLPGFGHNYPVLEPERTYQELQKALDSIYAI